MDFLEGIPALRQNLIQLFGADRIIDPSGELIQVGRSAMQFRQDSGLYLLALQEVLHSLGREHDLVGNAFRVNLLELIQNDVGGVKETLDLGRAGGDYGIFGREVNFRRQGLLPGEGRSSPMNFDPGDAGCPQLSYGGLG